MNNNILIAQSGGPTAAINAALAGIISAALKSDNTGEIFGGVNGVQGILEENIISLTERFEGDEDALRRLMFTPDMYLKTCRYKNKKPEEDDSDYTRLTEIFKKYNIGMFFYIGGNDSMDTVARIKTFTESRGLSVKVVGVPKTIDNDLVEIDHAPGFGSAVKYVATTFREVMMDTGLYPLEYVAVVEIMGRDSGWLTAAAVLAPPENFPSEPVICLPEVPFDKEKFIDRVNEEVQKAGFAVVAVSEGLKDKDGNYISASTGYVDKFGHPQLSGTASALAGLIKEAIGCKVRSIDLGSAQRSAGHISSETDINESYNLGENAFRYASEGKSGIMATLTRKGNDPYIVEYGYVDVTKVANRVKDVPPEWIDEDNFTVTADMIHYLRPLTEGETKVDYKEGLPDYLYDRY